MTTKVRKWGNSLAIRIPMEFAKSVGLKEGNAVSFVVNGQTLTIKNRKKPEYTLKELLKGYKKSKGNREFDWGKPVGNEVW